MGVTFGPGHGRPCSSSFSAASEARYQGDIVTRWKEPGVLSGCPEETPGGPDRRAGQDASACAHGGAGACAAAAGASGRGGPLGPRTPLASERASPASRGRGLRSGGQSRLRAGRKRYSALSGPDPVPKSFVHPSRDVQDNSRSSGR